MLRFDQTCHQRCGPIMFAGCERGLDSIREECVLLIPVAGFAGKGAQGCLPQAALGLVLHGLGE